MNAIDQKIVAGERISVEEATSLMQDADLYRLGFLANTVRKRMHPEPLVTYVIDRNINYTDICVSACKFCAFFKAPEDEAGMVLSFAELGQKIAETKALGGTQIILQ
ncbi:MAG: dehypoxanthine futalosine cyclase, partial [Desulfobulbaceae bacterium]|nr:dehypoxanthine futalosine cyclase [Desulfobulbaceae bacterium]